MSCTCFGFVTGIPAIVLGAVSRREIDRSQGTLWGSGIAAGGIAAGLFGTGASLVLLMTLLGGAVASVSPPTSKSRVPVAAGTQSYGSFDVVDVDASRGHRLDGQLLEIAQAGAGKGRTVVLQTYVRDSDECAEVAIALTDTQMQRALANVTLVRVDVEDFPAELRRMHVTVDTVPWFYKLDASAHPTDAISGDEWDANVAENIAPVLGPFVTGTLRTRRSPSPFGVSL